MTWYIDASAFLKLIFAEPESRELVRFVESSSRADNIYSSQLLATEAGRAVEREGRPQGLVDDQLRRVALLLPSAPTFEAARHIAPASLRSLDAIHLATAAELGTDLEGLISYDTRLIEAARAVGILTVSPGAG